MVNPDIPATYLARIQTAVPELVIESARLNQDGLVNDVVILNEQFVARFPKDERAREALARECRVLALVRQSTTLPVPSITYQAEDLVLYPFLKGEPLSRELLLRQDERTQDQLADQLGQFLYELHTISVDTASEHGIGHSEAERTLEDWARLFEAVEHELFPFLWAHQKTWVRQLFAPVLDGSISLSYTPGLVHGDLAAYHILYSAEQSRISGVLDFGTAGVGDPATDYACIIQTLGEGFLRRMAQRNSGLGQQLQEASMLDRARFRAGAVELEWALHGLRNNDPSWWLAHISGARDVLPLGTVYM